MRIIRVMDEREKEGIMELTGELKEKVEQTKDKEEAKKAIEDAGVILNDEELDQVAGGAELWTFDDGVK